MRCSFLKMPPFFHRLSRLSFATLFLRHKNSLGRFMSNTVLSSTTPLASSVAQHGRNFAGLQFVSLGMTAAAAQNGNANGNGNTQKSEGGVEYDVTNIPNAKMEMRLSVYAIPKYKGESRMGFNQGVLEDQSEFGQAGEGVADGVGGWAGVPGADSAAYSRQLMCGAAILAKKLKPPTGPVSPLEILSTSYSSMDPRIIGSTTACIISVDLLNSKFFYSNLGDSGFMLIRNGTMVQRTEDQLHGFNCPYQLGKGSSDLPIHAAVGAVDIEPGDILLVATDGVFDNLSDDELCDHIISKVKARQQAQALKPSRNTTSSTEESLAESIAALARTAASDHKRRTPFSEYSALHGYDWPGGKEDDITVVVTEFKDAKSARAEKMRPKL